MEFNAKMSFNVYQSNKEGNYDVVHKGISLKDAVKLMLSYKRMARHIKKHIAIVEVDNMNNRLFELEGRYHNTLMNYYIDYTLSNECISI